MRRYSLNELYRVAGISKQGAAQYQARQEIFNLKVLDIIEQADLIRKEHPGCGVEKMYAIISPDFIGRDRFIELFMGLGYRLKVKRIGRRTTYSVAAKWPNLIKGIKLDSPNQVWQSDITYIRVGEEFHYAVFIIDVYTKRIVGHQVSSHMRAEANLKALNRAIGSQGPPKIHHSDRGGQYIDKRYVSLLGKNKTSISLATSAMDNAYAERVNGTIKNEYLAYWEIKTLKELKKAVDKAVMNYNEIRPHNSLNKMSPAGFERYLASLSEENRPVVEIYNYEG